MNKICPQCGLEKPVTAAFFYRSKQAKSGFKPWCKLCVDEKNRSYDASHKRARVRRVLRSRNRSVESKQRHIAAITMYRQRNPNKYRDTRVAKRLGLPKGWVIARLEKNGGCCEICGERHLTKSNRRFLSVDHCHINGKVRGMLCTECNFGLGKFKDNPELLRAAAVYLETHAEQQSNSARARVETDAAVVSTVPSVELLFEK